MKDEDIDFSDIPEGIFDSGQGDAEISAAELPMALAPGDPLAEDYREPAAVSSGG